jgi:hypothetical protein
MQTKRVVLAGLAMLAASSVAFTGQSATDGTVSGSVRYEGTPPQMKPIQITRDPACASIYRNTLPPLAEGVVTGPGHSLENVVVYVSAGAPADAAPPTPAVLTQKGCRFVPHVLALHVNQELLVRDEDRGGIVHNVHVLPKLNPEWNKTMGQGSPDFKEKFAHAEMIAVKCNYHPWMHATLAVLKNRYYAVTHNGGKFSLTDLPPGEYTITAWHEVYGKQSQQVTISGNETKTVNFVFKVKP